MKIAYFDCFAGISGDMFLGSLADAGLEVATLKDELVKLGLCEWDLKVEKVQKRGIAGTKVSVITTEEAGERHLEDINRKTKSSVNEVNRLIAESALSDDVKQLSKEIFLRIATAEAKVHGIEIEKVHFHEVGAIDSIIDIVGSVIGIKKMGIEAVYASPLHLGTGFIKCAHGTLPVPVPATAELIANVPTYSQGIKAELVTPTGAAIITTLAKDFGQMPPMKVKRIGYGAGTRDLPIPNLLRVLIADYN